MSQPGTELAVGYVSLASSSKGLGRSIIADLKGSRRGMSAEGTAAGGAYQQSLVGGVKNRLGPLLRRAVAAGTATAGIGAVIGKGFGRLTAIENAEAKLRGLGNSAADITSIMNDALTAVRGTAFAMDEAATVAATAVAAGVKPGKELENYLRLTADAATIAGVSMSEMGAIINKTTTNGKVFTEELQQLAERGLPVWQWLQEEYGVSAEKLREMVSKGEIDAARFRKAIDENIGGAALSSGDTTVGAWKNMGASLSRIGANLIKGIFPRIKGGIQGVTGALSGVEPVALSIGQKIGTAFTDVATRVRAAADLVSTGDFTAKIREALGFEEDSPVVGVLLGLRQAWLDTQAAITGGTLLASLSQFSPLLAAISGAVGSLTPHLPAIAGGFTQFGAAVGGALAAALPTVLNVGAELVPVIAGLASSAAQIVPPILGAAAGMVAFVAPVLQSETAVKVLGGTILGIVAAMKIYQVTTTAVAAVQAAKTAVTAAAAGVQTGYGLATYGVVAATYAQGAAQKAGLVVAGAVRVATLIATAAQWAWNAAMSANPIGIVIVAIAALVAGLIWFFTQTEVGRQVFATAMGVIQTAIGAVVGFFQNTVAPVFQSVWGGILSVIDGVVGFFTGTVQPIFAAVFAKIGSDLTWLWTTIFKPVFDAITNVISTAVRIAQLSFAAIGLAFTTVGNLIGTIYNGYIFPIFDLFAKIIGWLANVIFAAAMKHIQDVWRGLSIVFQSIYNTVIKPVVDFFAARIEDFKRGFAIIMLAVRRAWAQLAAGVRTVYNTVIKPVIDFFAKRIADFKRGFAIVMAAVRVVWSNLANGVRDIYNRVIKAVIGWFSDRINWLKVIFGKAIDAIRTAWGRVRDTIVGVYNKNIKPIFDAFSTLIGKVKGAFDTAVEAIGVAWNGLKEKAKEPIKFVINTVINGLIGKFNEIAKFFGAATMDPLSLPAGFKAGGELPGSTSGQRDKYTVVDEHGRPRARVEPGEYIAPRWMSPIFGTLEALRQRGRSALAGLKDGGRFWPGTTHALSGNYSGHSGIDIPDPRGAPIYAMGDGAITYAGWGRGYGNAIFQSLAGGLQAVYGHTLRTLKNAGDQVSGGQKIALVDSTGNSSGNHIHAEINGAGGFGSAANRQFTINWLKGAVSGFSGAGTEGSGEDAGFDPWAALKGVFDTVVSSVTDLTGPLRDLVGNLLNGIGSHPFAKMAGKVPGKVVEMAIEKVKSLFDGGAPGDFGDGTGNVNGNAGAIARRAAAELGPKFGFSDIGTYAGHDPSEARALDFMTKTKGQGDSLFAFMRANAARLGVMYLIWYRKIWSVARAREGIRDYTRYGNTSDPSQAHTNHVHASFYENGGMAQRGLGIVGERRAELVDFGRGGQQVYPDAMAMLENAAKVMAAIRTLEAAGSTAGSGDGRVAFVITNWKTGEGYFRELAADEARQDATYGGLIDRMGG